MPTITVYIRAENYDKLREKARNLDKSEGEIINLLISKFIEQLNDRNDVRNFRGLG